MNREVRFRAYHDADLSVCADIGVDAFPLVTSRFAGEEVSKVMRGQVDSCHAVSNYGELAIADREVAGFIFGRVRRKPVSLDTARKLKRVVLISARFLLGRYGGRGRLIRFLDPCLEQLRVLRQNTPAREAEVVLFAVAPEHQGSGVGRALMNRFVGHALRYKVKSISVPTDETASFRFYERYGFRRWAEFTDPLASYCAGRPVKGFTYQLLLP